VLTHQTLLLFASNAGASASSAETVLPRDRSSRRRDGTIAGGGPRVLNRESQAEADLPRRPRPAGARGAPLRRRARRQTVSTASTRAARTLRPGAAVPTKRPPTAEEVIDEPRARLRGDPSTQPTAHTATGYKPSGPRRRGDANRGPNHGRVTPMAIADRKPQTGMLSPTSPLMGVGGLGWSVGAGPATASGEGQEGVLELVEHEVFPLGLGCLGKTLAGCTAFRAMRHGAWWSRRAAA
jgi:hypothetical protein